MYNTLFFSISLSLVFRLRQTEFLSKIRKFKRIIKENPTFAHAKRGVKMQLAKNIDALKKSLGEWKSLGLSVGFVPTMGALHLGHLSLIEQAISENNKVVCSIFVNPTQFNNPKDLENYPIQVDEDLVLLKEAGCDLVFTPTKTEMYPHGEEVVQFNINGLDNVMEGAHREGHFDGMHNHK